MIEYKNAKFYNCDCMLMLKEQSDESVDLIFADAPYNIGKDFGNSSDKWKDGESFLDWCFTWIDECFRVLKPNGTFYIMMSTQFMPYLDIYVQECYNVVNRIVWSYDSSGVQAKTKFGSMYEPILMCTKSDKAKYTFNADAIKVPAKTGCERHLIDYRKNPPEPYANEKVPGNVWTFPRVRYRMPEYVKHPTQKPESLLERVVMASSNEGDIVLDPFLGSFTTAAVGLKLGRYVIGSEINEDYFEQGLERCAKYLK